MSERGFFEMPSGQSEKEKADLREEVEKVLDVELETMLEWNVMKKCNDGNNGVIFRFDLKDVSPEFREAAKGMGVNLEEASATKVLKIYEAGKAKHEYVMQKTAYDIMEKYRDNPEYAQIPKPHFAKKITITNTEVKEKLKMSGVRLGQENEVEMLVMDFIEGEDLGTGLFKEVVKRDPQQTHKIEDETIKFEELHMMAQGILGYKDVSAGGQGNPEKEQEMFLREARNTNLLIGFLRRNNFVLDPQIIRQIRNTMDVLHKHGFYCRDSHPRNFMVTGDMMRGGDSSKTPKVSVIDFGTAVADAKGGWESVYRPDEQGIEKKYTDDYYVPRLLESLTLSRTEQAAKEKNDAQFKLRERLTNEKISKLFSSERIATIKNADTDGVYEVVMKVVHDPIKLEVVIGEMLSIVDSHPERALPLFEAIKNASKKINEEDKKRPATRKINPKILQEINGFLSYLDKTHKEKSA